MNIELLRLIRLSDDYPIKPFKCSVDSLSKFLIKEAKDYQKKDFNSFVVNKLFKNLIF